MSKWSLARSHSFSDSVACDDLGHTLLILENVQL
jgi:hypothetical protein